MGKPVIELQRELRKKILELHYAANAGHIGCSLSCIDILISVLICHRSENDSFILSKGHAASALYVCLNYLNEISDDDLKTFYKNGTSLSAHPAPNKFKSIPFATGSLGHGFPLGVGIAKAKKLSGEEGTIYVIMSDGETNEGTTWESAHFARQHELDNLVIIVDKNRLQGFGKTDNVLGDTCTSENWASLGFESVVVEGHDIGALQRTLQSSFSFVNKKPKVIIAETIKGKGISFMEDKLDWHYLPMTEDLFIKANKEILQKYS